MPKTEEELKLEIEEKKDDGEQIVIEHAEDAPKTEAKGKEAAKAVEIPVEAGIAELKRKLEESESGRAIAENRAQQLEGKAKAALAEVGDTNLRFIDSALETSKSNIAILKGNLKQARADGDIDAEIDAQAQLSEAISNQTSLKQGRIDYEKKLKETPKVEARAEDPAEIIAADIGKRYPKSAAWIRAHPEYARNQGLYRKMVAAHELTVSNDIKEDSPEYFESVEKFLGISKPAPKVEEEHEEQENALSEAAKPVQSRSSPAAPVSRTPSNNSGNRPKVVKLTSAERETADNMGMSYQDYAKNKLQLIEEGKMTA